MLPSPAPDVCWLYLLRHGATTHNLSQPPIMQGRTVDLNLSEVGRGQAQATAKFLHWAQLGAVYSSDLKRARETAEIVAAPHQRTVQVRPELTEVDVGRWESMSWGEIERTDPEAYRLFHDGAGTHGYGGGENLTQVLERVRPVMDEILNDNLGRSIAVIGHNVVNRTFLAHVLGIHLSKTRKLLQDNCCINLLRYRRGETMLWTLNSTFHLRA
jgi:broad specificity phosphatase PhoE